jgi:hypothetical protein
LSENVTLVHQVNTLYRENATSQFSWDLEKIPEPREDEHQSVAAMHSGSYESSGPMHHLYGQSGQRPDYQYHYFVNIRARKGEYAGAYKVFVFFDAEHKTTEATAYIPAWIHDPGFVGFTGFASTAVLSKEETREVNGVVALTKALEERVIRGKLLSLNEADVAAYLQERMTWQIVVVSLTPTSVKVSGPY